MEAIFVLLQEEMGKKKEWVFRAKSWEELGAWWDQIEKVCFVLWFGFLLGRND